VKNIKNRHIIYIKYGINIYIYVSWQKAIGSDKHQRFFEWFLFYGMCFEIKIKKNNFNAAGAAHPNICRLRIELYHEGAAHRNTRDIAVRCTFFLHQQHLYYKYYRDAVAFCFSYIVGLMK
jgi:hypothetical protein